MSQTMLQLMQETSNELGLVAPTYVAGNTNQDVIQLLALMNRQGYNLTKEYDWRALQKEYRFYTQSVSTTGDVLNGSYTILNVADTTGIVPNKWMVTGTGIPQDCYVVAVSGSTVTLNQPAQETAVGTTLTFGQTQYDLPPDYETITDRTQWDKTKHWEMLGPEDAQQWQWLKSGYISTGPRVRWRILGQYFNIWPMMNTQEYLGYEYRSKGWAESSTGQVKNSFTADTDTTLFDDQIMILGTKLRYWQIKGFDTTSLQQEYDRYLSVAKANDKGAPNLSFAPYPSKVLIGYANIPDTGYGS
jgi:hypothetical protein